MPRHHDRNGKQAGANDPACKYANEDGDGDAAQHRQQIANVLHPKPTKPNGSHFRLKVGGAQTRVDFNLTAYFPAMTSPVAAPFDPDASPLTLGVLLRGI